MAEGPTHWINPIHGKTFRKVTLCSGWRGLGLLLCAAVGAPGRGGADVAAGEEDGRPGTAPDPTRWPRGSERRRRPAALPAVFGGEQMEAAGEGRAYPAALWAGRSKTVLKKSKEIWCQKTFWGEKKKKKQKNEKFGKKIFWRKIQHIKTNKHIWSNFR